MIFKGFLLSAFGVAAWYGFLFAGSGHALLICTVIVLIGICMMISGFKKL